MSFWVLFQEKEQEKQLVLFFLKMQGRRHRYSSTCPFTFPTKSNWYEGCTLKSKSPWEIALLLEFQHVKGWVSVSGSATEKENVGLTMEGFAGSICFVLADSYVSLPQRLPAQPRCVPPPGPCALRASSPEWTPVCFSRVWKFVSFSFFVAELSCPLTNSQHHHQQQKIRN